MPIPLRSDYDAGRVRAAARESKNANQVRRLLALAAIYDGAPRAEAAEIGGVTRQIIRDWVLKFNANGPDGLIDRKAPGQPSRLNEFTGRRWQPRSRAGRYRRCMASCAGLLSISANGCGTSFGSASPSRHSAASCVRCAFANCRHARAITVRLPRVVWRLFKKPFPQPAWPRSHASQGGQCRRDRNLVRRRSSPRPEEQDHPPLGQARHAALCSPGSPHRIGLYFRCYLSSAGKSRRADPAMVQY